PGLDRRGRKGSSGRGRSATGRSLPAFGCLALPRWHMAVAAVSRLRAGRLTFVRPALPAISGRKAMTKSGTVRAGMGGWTFEPWNTAFYPEKLAKTKQLHYASRQVPTIEVNGTYYSSF